MTTAMSVVTLEDSTSDAAYGTEYRSCTYKDIVQKTYTFYRTRHNSRRCNTGKYELINTYFITCRPSVYFAARVTFFCNTVPYYMVKNIYSNQKTRSLMLSGFVSTVSYLSLCQLFNLLLMKNVKSTTRTPLTH
jgi:hypothetical protein